MVSAPYIPMSQQLQAMMNRRRHQAIWIALLAITAIALPSARAQHAAQFAPAAEVNPMIGTGGDPDDGINLFPGAAVPFGMVQISPDTEDHGFGYHYIHSRIKGFSMTHMSGPGCANEGDVFFTATTGPVHTQGVDFQSPYSHKEESSSPGYYRVQLLQWGINAELTATEHTGLARLSFPAGQIANFLVPISHTLNETAAASIHVVGDRRIEGYVENHAFCNMKPSYKVYFVILFNRPFSSFGTWTGAQYGGPGTIAAGSRQAAQSGHDEWTGAYASWPAEDHEQTITASIGISYVDIHGAEQNLRAETEGKDFNQIRNEATGKWNQELGSIEISGGTATRRRIFYTALYHSLLMPSTFSDVDGRYLGFDAQVHTVQNGHRIYANFSGWDIYRSQMPLLAMMEPERVQDMAQSVVLMYKQGGWVGRWPQINLYTNDMVGSPLSIFLATAWLDGLHGFDIDSAWEGMLKDATTAPPSGKPYLGEEGIEWLNRLHYLPDDKVNYGSVAKTQEYSLAYASLARLATGLGKTEDAKMLYQRARYHRNLFDSESGFFRPRNADGSWVADFDPAQDGHGFVEGTAWHYVSFAPADLAWLVQAMGRDHFNRKMTEFFNYPLPGWYGSYYNPYNETDFQAPYVFNFSGQPWKSQKAVRRILSENYLDAPDGIPGNDDCGATSSWAVLSMMGIYSVDPASLAYEFVGPSFPKIVLHLRAPYQGHEFVIASSPNPESKPYIQRATLNGRMFMHNWISFDEIQKGGVLHFDVGAEPNPSWGAAPEDAPPSLSN